MSFKVIASKGRHKVVAFNAIQQGVGPSGASMSTAALLGTNLKSGLLEGIIEESSNQEIQAIYRDIYFHDPIAGAAVDLKANLPWSDFNLIGATEDQLKVFMDTIERLNLKTLHVEMSTDQMVSGAFLGSLVYKNGGFSDVIPFDYAYAKVTPNPLYSEDPVIQVEVSPELKSFVNSNIPAVKEIHSRLPQDIMTALRTAKEIDLDPLSTIYLPRTSLSTIQTGVSYFRRILPLYLIERVLYRGTLSEVTRRQRSTLHITAGDEDWIPTSEELSEIVGLFQSTEMDPISSVVATRNSIQTNEIRCLAYDTLIATNEGLITIEDLYKGKHIEGREVKTHLSALNHKGEFAKIDTVIYQGKKPVLNVTLADGTTLRPTANHKFLTVDANLSLTLKTIQDVEYVLKTTKVDARHNEYEFDLQYPDVEMRPANADIKLPKRMTPKLAYCLALIISEGYMSPSTVSIANSDLKILKRVKNFMKDVFNIEGVIKMADTEYSESVIRGVRRKFKSAHNLEFYTKSLTGVLEQMGIIISSELSTDTHSSSYLKQVPDCILQADRESQLAFLSGYIDGDGGTKNYESRAKQGNDLIWRSTSHQIVKSIHAMLCEMGYLSKLYLGNVSAHECSSVTLTWGEVYKILPHLKCIKLQNKELASSRTYGQGIPGNLIYDALKSRDVTKRNEKVNGQRGSVFLSDTGARVFIPGGYATLVAPFKNNTTCMSYDNFKAGKYNKLLTIIQKVSNRLYKNLMNILNNEYAFVEVASIEEGPTVSTYDLHMDESNAPLFCINGNVITKNSAGDFFKWTDVADQLSFMKMRALGINESFLSGDASYNTLEMAMSTFIEDLRTYRERETRRLYYDKLFPLIAVANNFYKEENKTTATRLQTTRLMKTLNDTNNLVIPEVHWHKPLQPEADQSYMEILSTLEDKGLPVPLRMWAAAGGYNLDKILADQEADADISKKVEEYKKVVNSNTEEASLRAMAGLRPQHFLNRDYGEAQEIVGYTVTGKKKYIHNQKLANEKMNMAAAKALTNLADPNKFQDALKRGKK